jgi:hypothetical protein
MSVKDRNRLLRVGGAKVSRWRDRQWQSKQQTGHDFAEREVKKIPCNSGEDRGGSTALKDPVAVIGHMPDPD